MTSSDHLTEPWVAVSADTGDLRAARTCKKLILIKMEHRRNFIAQISFV
jgi:hypothetical protein